jgi:hypothetical protein
MRLCLQFCNNPLTFVEGRDSRQVGGAVQRCPLTTGVDKLTLSTFNTVSAANPLAFRLCVALLIMWRTSELIIWHSGYKLR